MGALDRIVRREDPDPHAVLGPHREGGAAVVRVFRPEADSVAVLLDDGTGVELERVHETGGFAGRLASMPAPGYRLEVAYPDGNRFVLHDPYAFGPTVEEGDHGRLGAHVVEHEGVTGTSFSVWAPAAQAVSVVGDFNSWDARMHPMRRLGDSGVWELFLPDSSPGQRYKFEMLTAAGQRRLKADPRALQAAPEPDTASVIHAPGHAWRDEDWTAARRADHRRSPISIYEVHLGSWGRDLGELAQYVRDLGFTHVELLPVMAHPFIGSWGYQVTSYFAPAPRYGSPDELRALIDGLHQHGLGVILDWVPAHFPKDDWALRRFDGTELYEHEDPRRGEHPDWGTLVFDFARREVRDFLLASARHWLRSYHADGLRVDAVTSMLHLDFSRGEGEWTPNAHGGREDLDAVAFVQELNQMVEAEGPGLISAAEEATVWPGVTRPVAEGGLGFGYKWNMGWLYDTLAYFAQDPVTRRSWRPDLAHTLSYAFDEHFVLPLSHDEVVHGKGSLLRRMTGSDAEQFANLRSLYAYTWASPGKPLLFMGGEFGQEREWSHDRGLDWHLLGDARHAGVQSLVRELNRLYRGEPALWARDGDPAGFAWIDDGTSGTGVLAFARAGGEDDREVVCVCNLTGERIDGLRLGLPRGGRWEVLIDTEAEAYGGAGTGDPGTLDAVASPSGSQPFSASLALPEFSVLWLAPAG